MHAQIRALAHGWANFVVAARGLRRVHCPNGLKAQQ